MSTRPADRSRPPAAPYPRGLERLTDRPVALAVSAAGAMLGRLGPAAAYRVAGLLGDAWRRAVPSRRLVAVRNLEIAFRDGLGPAGRDRIAAECYRHSMATAVDVFLRERRLGPGTWREAVEVGPEVEELIARPHPRGLVVLSAHLGDWEMIQFFLALRGLPVAAVARTIHNPHLDRLATRRRSRHGASVIGKAGALREVWKSLRRGGAAGLMPDQSAPPAEGFADFFAAAAATYSSWARLVARARPDVAFVACLRDGFRFRFRIAAEDLGGALDGAGEEDRTRALVRAYLDRLEAAIRGAPEQYLWMHRRWKCRPPGAPDLYRDLGRPLAPGLLEREPAATG